MKKKPLVAWDRGRRFEFPSLTEAAEYYNTNISSISCAIKRGTSWRRVMFEYVDSITSPVLSKEPEKDSLVVTIKDKTYYSVKVPNKTNCENCDIFKDKKPVSMNDCIRLRRNDICRLDLKPCKENCPLKKTKDEQQLYLDEVRSNECLWEIEVCRSMVKRLSNIFYKTNDISASGNNTGEIREEQEA